MFPSAARPRRATLRIAPGAALLILGVLAASVPAGAEPSTPDSADLSALATDLAQARAVRVTGTFGTRVLQDVRLDGTGVAASNWGPGGRARTGLIVSRDVMPPRRPGPIAWSEISRIETGRTSTGRFATAGVVLGGLLGVIAWRTIPVGSDGGPGPEQVMIGVPALTGLAFGAFLGSQQYQWHTVYARGYTPGPGSRRSTQ